MTLTLVQMVKYKQMIWFGMANHFEFKFARKYLSESA